MHDHHHAIHLGAAWEPPAPAAAGGVVLWTRRFGRPAGLEPGDRVLLVIVRPAVAAGMAVNAVPLPSLEAGATHWTHDITSLLRERNELVISVATAVGLDAALGSRGRSPLPSAVGTVRLEIVSAIRRA